MNPGTNIIQRIILPSKDLSQLVKHYLFLKSPSKKEPFSDKFIPDGYMAIVIHFTGKFYAFIDDKYRQLPRTFMVPPLCYSLTIKVEPPGESMIVILKTTVFSRLFNVDLVTLRRTLYKPATEIVSERVWEALNAVASDDEKVSIFESYLKNQADISSYVPDKIDLLFEKIHESRGERMMLQNLVKEIGIHPRTFRRQFLLRTGMNAQTLSHVVRFNYLWTLFLKTRISDYQSMVFQGSYFDQAHMIRDFKRFVGESPRKFFGRDQDIMRFISGKQEDEGFHGSDDSE
jgi:AraC-like DNA-binding protein